MQERKQWVSGRDLSTCIGYRRERCAPLLHTLATDFGKWEATLEQLASCLGTDAATLVSALDDSNADRMLNSSRTIYRDQRGAQSLGS